MKFNAAQARKRAATGDPMPPLGLPPPGLAPGPPAGGAPSSVSSAEARAERKRKRKSRWAGNDDDKTFIPGMPTMMPQGLSKDQETAYLRKLTLTFPYFMPDII